MDDFILASVGGSYFKIFKDVYGDYKIEMSDGGKKPFDFMVSPNELRDLKEWLDNDL